ncbi:uncharacterized protein LOC129944424 isoform X5 [Eupeodes corollae]|uniref:uncharacterized protein LOC129944424 isoform X5 n=1 Tax=Eupeodes corollae TaxID=290404 RepID=UPI0024936DA4|nr:uncharacterized protein LOC129944424 isoform X5 [Eupeodes corollae]
MDDDFTDYEVLHNYYEDEEEFASPTPSPFPEPVANSWEVSQVQEKDQRSFPEEKTELLIETIKKYPSLWNIKDKNYRNRVERNSDWTKVLVEIDSSNQVQQKLQSEAISLLKEINKPREEKTYATLTCELVRQDMESLPDLEQRALRIELFELVDRFVARNLDRGAD